MIAYRNIAAWLFVGSSVLAPAHAGPVGSFQGHTYEEVTVPAGLSWANANTAAQSMGGQLVVVETQAENEFLISFFDVFSAGNPANFVDSFPCCGQLVYGPWIGLRLVGVNGSDKNNYQWVDGAAFSQYFDGFAAFEPNNNGPGAGVHFLSIFDGASRGWGDEQGTPVRSFIIERVPEPSSILLLAIALGVLVAGRRQWN
jgi:lectin-like protein/PEP-CTERM motif-containing protein